MSGNRQRAAEVLALIHNVTGWDEAEGELAAALDAAEERGRVEGRRSRYYDEADVVLALSDDFLIEHPPEHGEVEPEVVYDWFVKQAHKLRAAVAAPAGQDER